MFNNFNKSILILFPILTICIFFNIYYEGLIYKLNNIETVLIFCLLSLLIINKNSFNFHKETLIIYLFILICLISCFFSENVFLSLKRFILVFIPFVIIFQTYLNVENVDNIKNKFEALFIYLVLFLVFYSLLIFATDFFSKSYIYHLYKDENLNISKNISRSLFGFGQRYFERGDLFRFFLRPSSLLSNTIGFSHLILIAIILNYSNKNLNTSFRISNFLILVPALVWTFSRVNILILFLFPLILILSKKKSLLITLLFGKILFFLFMILFIHPSFNQLINIDFDKLNLGQLPDRFDIFKIVILKIESYFVTGVGFGVSSENFLKSVENINNEFMKFYNMSSSFYEVTHNRNLAIASVPLTIFVETGVLGFITYSLILPTLIFLNKNFKSANVKNIFCLLIVIQLTQVSDISLLRFHMITFLFAMYLGISCNKSVKIND